jgi:hypothetical protein
MGLSEATGRIGTVAYEKATHPATVLTTIATLLATMVGGIMWGLPKIEAAQMAADSANTVAIATAAAMHEAVEGIRGQNEYMIKLMTAQMIAQGVKVPEPPKEPALPSRTVGFLVPRNDTTSVPYRHNDTLFVPVRDTI